MGWWSTPLCATLLLLILAVPSLSQSEEYSVQHVNFENFDDQDLSRARRLLRTEGILAITGVSGLEDARREALVSAGLCALNHGPTVASVNSKLKDGSNRASWAAFVDTEQPETVDYTPKCPDLQGKMESLRRVVDLGAQYFARLVESSILITDDVLLTEADGTRHASFRDMVSKTRHLDHFHVYNASMRSAQPTLDLHTDQGLFIAFVPSIRVSLGGFVDKHDDGLLVQLASGKQMRAKFPEGGDVLVFMMGDEANLISNGHSSPPMRPMPHALSLDTLPNDALRSWFGRMFFTPRDSPMFTKKRALTDSRSMSVGCTQGGIKRVLEDATGNGCEPGEVYCWMSCHSIEHFPCANDTLICQRGDGEICVDCHDESTRLVCPPTAAPLPPPSPPPKKSCTETKVSLGSLMDLSFCVNTTHGVFRVQSRARGYIGLGIGTLMLNSVAIIGMDPLANPTDVAVGLYRIISAEGDREKLATDAKQLISFGIVQSSFSALPTATELQFTVDYSLQKPVFTLIRDSVDVIYAVGSSVFEEHVAFGSRKALNFSISTATIGEEATQVPEGAYVINSTLAAHIIIMILAWQVVAPVGVLFPLVNRAKGGVAPGKKEFSWFNYHWAILTLGVILGYIGTLLGYLYVGDKGKSHWSTPHKALGLVVLLVSIIQPLLGRFRPHKDESHSVQSTARRAFEVVHPLLGYSVVILGMVNALVGVEQLFDTSGKQLFTTLQENGPSSATGFSGPLGIAVIFLCVLFGTIYVGIWSCVLVNGCKGRGGSFPTVDSSAKTPASEPANECVAVV